MSFSDLISQAIAPIRRYQFVSSLNSSLKNDLPELVSRMTEWPRVNRQLEPYAVAAAFVSHLSATESVKRNALGQMIHSRSFGEALYQLSSEDWKNLRQPKSKQTVLPPGRVVDSCLADGVLKWEGETLRDALRCIVQAQGLVPAVLALERWLAGVSDQDSAEAERVFRQWEDHFNNKRLKSQDQSHSSVFSWPATKGAFHLIDEEEFFDPSTTLESLSSLQILYEGLRPLLRKTGTGRNCDPVLLTHYFLKPDNNTIDRINSLPRTLISAHFGLQTGIDLQVYLGSELTALFHPPLQTILDYWVYPSGFLIAPEEAQRSGLFADRQAPAPIEAIFAGVLRNLAKFKETAADKMKFYRAALEVYPDDCASLIQMASLYPGMENLLLRAIDHWRRNLLINERLGVFYAREQHYSNAREHIQDAIFSLIAHRVVAEEVFQDFMDVTLWTNISDRTLARLKHRLAQIFDKEGNKKEALREIHEALDLDPQNKEASLDLERMLFRN